MRNIITAIFLFIVLNAGAQQKDDQQIREAMKLQIDGWNSGDLNGYMSTYWNSDSLMFIGKSGVTYGWQNTMDNYKKGYPDRESMGKLSFELIQVKRLSVLYYHVVGKWHLERSESKGNLSGHFTLLFKKIRNKWVIVSDHSS